MLRNRAVTVHLGERAVRSRVCRGCPQGSVLSPTLWNLTVDSLLAELTSIGIKVICYADDVVLIVRGRFLSTIAEIIQRALCVVEVWCRKQGLSVNANKTDMIIFSRKKSVRPYKKPIFFGQELQVVREVK